MSARKNVFMKTFELEIWVLMAGMSIFTGLVVWLTKHAENNADFGVLIFHKFGTMLWFSVTVLSFAQRESIKSNLSSLVLTAWLFVVVIVAACFTAVLTSMMTVTQLQPTIVDIDYLQRTNAAVGCNGNSFIVKYLVGVLHFHPENIKVINSINEYPEAFKRREISAAFLVAPHAMIFLTEYCQGYAIAGPRFKLGCFGFVFPKGSPLVAEISEAILKVTQTGEVNKLERHMLSFANCSSTSLPNVPSLGPGPFSGLFIISGTISTVAFLITAARMLGTHWPIVCFTQEKLIQRRVWVDVHQLMIFSRSQGSLSRSIDDQKSVCRCAANSNRH